MMDISHPSGFGRTPVLARNAVASSQPLATQAGLEALQLGGNAVDAALATAITLTVVEPTMNGLGGDGFALVWDGKKLHGLNASGRAPTAWTPEFFAGKSAMPLSAGTQQPFLEWSRAGLRFLKSLGNYHSRHYLNALLRTPRMAIPFRL